MAVITGSCFCGGVKVTISGESGTQDGQISCHCTDCQQTSGAAHSTNILPKQADTKIEGSVKEYDAKAPSGNTVTRVFCSTCGSAIAHKSKAFGDALAVQTGNLKGFSKVPIVAELFTKDRYTSLGPVAGAAQKETM